MKKQKPFTIVILAAALSLILAGCGNSSKSSSTKTSGTAASSQDVAKDHTAAMPYLENPKTIGVDKPLSKRPPHQSIVWVYPPSATTNDIEAGGAAAAKLLDWSFKVIPEGSTASGVPDAFNLALTEHPNAIVLSAGAVSQVAAGLTTACKENIAVELVSVSTTPADFAHYPCLVDPENVTGNRSEASFGQIMGPEVAAMTNGNAHVVIISLTGEPALNTQSNGFQQSLKHWCPTCTAKEVDVELPELGTPALANQVVNYLRTNPSTNIVYDVFGDLGDGVPEALAAAGLNNSVRLVGVAPTTTEVNSLKAGGTGAWLAVTFQINGYEIVDQLARHAVGDSQAPTDTYNSVPEILTGSNAAHAVYDSSGNYLGIADFQPIYAKLWGISG